MIDAYPGLDLLADVFPGTEDAPTPLIRRNANGNLQSLWPSPDDPRWHVHARLYPDGEIAWIDDRSIRPREAPESTKITELTPSPPLGDQKTGLGALRVPPTPGNGHPSADAPPPSRRRPQS